MSIIKIIAFIIWIACTIFLWVMYHKIFDVVYFDALDGIIKELFGCGILGVILMMLILKFWYIGLAIVGLVIGGACLKSKN